MRLPSTNLRRRRRPLLEQRDPAPFVVGVARSGTTLLRLMLDAHPQLAIPPETHFLPKLFKLSDTFASERRGDDELRQASFALITGHPRWLDFGLDEDDLWRHLSGYPEMSATVAARAFYEAYAELHGKPRWGDKTPSYTWKMPRIQRRLPEAHFIHLIRDGRDVALSLGEVTWGTTDVTEAARKWVDELTRARDRAGKLAAGTYLELRYEDLVADPEPLLRRASALVDLPWDDAMLDYHRGAGERMQEVARELRPGWRGTITAEERSRQHELVARPPSTERVGRWRREMPPADRHAFESVAGALLTELGYEV
jgi:Sulfotransferase family